MDIKSKQAARQFVDRWQSEPGNEEEQSRSFWIELTNKVLGIDDPTHVLEFERKVKGRKIDVFYEDMGILIEQKSRGVDLDKKSERSKKAGEETPYQQAKWYADNLPNSIRPDWIIISNFDEFRIHDLDSEDPENDYVSVMLEELPGQVHLLNFFTDESSSRLVKEKEISVQAGEIVGRLYKSLSSQYKNIETDKLEQFSLNVLIVRFVFLLYAEDAGLLQEHQAFMKYLLHVDPEDMRNALIQLFEVLNTPEGERDPYLPEKLASFPYINGDLFAKEDIIIPQFTQDIKTDLLLEASQEFDWSGISPTIFGAVFESTLNPDTRREGGMHYTSIENIHKVIDPLFLDNLKAELAQIEGEKVEKTRKLKLRQFQNKLATLKILDPACGSGNFLTESFLQLRKLENRVLESLIGEQMGLGLGVAWGGGSSELSPIKVSISQFYGIEINDFAVAVAKTALWIAEEQMMEATQEILLTPLDFLPLKSNDNIALGNALRMDWNEILPASECSYIIGNPPFLGYSNQSKEQKEEMLYIWKDANGKPIKQAGKIDYVSAWYYKAAQYIANHPIFCAFVSTNSITQGEQVQPIWETLKNLFDVHIDFAWTTFIWDNEASDKAHVHVVIIGFSSTEGKRKRLYNISGSYIVESINGYLIPGEEVFITKQKKPFSTVPLMTTGNRPADGGHLIIEEMDFEKFISQEPEAKKYIRPLLGSKEFINSKKRYCLWLNEVDYETINSIPLIKERVDLCKQDREKAPDPGRRKLASSPHLFREQISSDKPYLVVPKVSSERREYIPIGYVSPETIATDLLFVVLDGGLYEFGILTSRTHNAWMHVVAGRLKSDYRYSQDLVYNTFIFPDPTSDQKQKIEQLAQNILDIRDSYPDKSLADLYDPDKMPTDLLEAHHALDKAVEEAYGVDFNGDEEKIVAHLFKLYAEATRS